ncbi:phage tail assembly protein T [Sphingomonas guangdongensis]|uniref:phage tail assembly protein T n=1 Tax=Sphingomonas guangdongensis TaxID=1141890 RepID=UPI0015C86302|nr:hypothetical protein [Sphingomonas guangdongensis]
MAELDATLSPAEFEEWKVYFQVEPWGTAAADEHFRGLYQLFWCFHSKKTMPEFLDRFPEERARQRRREERKTAEEKIFDFFNGLG